MTLTKKELIDVLMQSDVPDDTPVWRSAGFYRIASQSVEIKTKNEKPYILI